MAEVQAAFAVNEYIFGRYEAPLGRDVSVSGR